MARTLLEPATFMLRPDPRWSGLLRASLLPADKVVEQAAFDKYNYIRDAYFQNRRSAIHDGNPPPLED